MFQIAGGILIAVFVVAAIVNGIDMIQEGSVKLGGTLIALALIGMAWVLF